MLKKENRLSKKEFDEVFKNGQKKFSPNFLFIKLKNSSDQKISVAVSKKIYKKAFERNKAKRIVYKILQENFSFESNPEKFWAIFLINKPILEIKNFSLKEEILVLLKKI